MEGFKPIRLSPYLTPFSAPTLQGFLESLHLLHLSHPDLPRHASSPKSLGHQCQGQTSTLKSLSRSEKLSLPRPGPQAFYILMPFFHLAPLSGEFFDSITEECCAL